MKIKPSLTVMEMGEEYVAVPTGDAAEYLKGVIRLNETGKEILQGLLEGLSEEQVAEKLLREYDGVDLESAKKYVLMITDRLRQTGLVEE